MLGETQKPIPPHPRSAEYLRAREKQILISTSAVEYPSSVSATGATALSEIGFSVENVITHAAEKSTGQSVTLESASPLKKGV